MRKNIALVLTFTVLSGIGVSGCEAADDEETKPAATASAAAKNQAITWGSCPAAAEGAPDRDPRQTCGTLKVPLNYGDPEGRPSRSRFPGSRRSRKSSGAVCCC